MTDAPPVAGRVGHALTSRACLMSLVALGGALRIWQYAANASLWADEGNMALNLVGRSLGGLFAPLDYRQVAPLGWLLVEKGALTLFGDGELALRLFPFLCSLGGLPLFWAVAARVLRGRSVPLAVGLFALGTPFLFYAAQLKPYSGDVAATLAILLLALEARRDDGPPRRAPWLAGIGALTVWFSHPAALVLAGVGTSLALLALIERDRRAFGSLSWVLALWGASAGAAALVARRGVTPGDVAYMQQFWAAWFMPIPPRSLADLVWPVTRLTSAFGGGGMHYPLPGLFVAFAGLGAWTLGRRAAGVTLLLLAPMGVTLAASAVRLYPFASRLVLFLLPPLLILVAAGAEHLCAWRSAGGRRAGHAVLGACALLALFALARDLPPYRPEHLKPVLAVVQHARQPGDRIYVYYGGEKAFRYYAARYGLRAGDYVLGGCWRDDPRAYLRELDGLRGASRVWVILTHALPELGEEALILGYLDQIGVRQATYRGSPRAREGGRSAAAGYLYDLSDPARPAGVSAETYVIPSRSRPAASGAWSC